MSTMDRRSLLVGLSAMAAGALSADGQDVPPALTGSELSLNASKVFAFEELPVQKKPNGAESRAVFHGVLATGEALEVHETMLPPGASPNPGHAHRPSDIICVRQGTLSIEHDGKVEKVGPGGVIFVASETMHSVKNVGDGPAHYFVIIIGREAAKQLV